VFPAGAVVWSGERILAVGPVAQLRRQFSDAHFLDAHGGLILPGLINLHHHSYSALARGLDPGAPLDNFTQILSRLWWRLDRALDPPTLRLSAQLSAVDCIRSGCTTVFDHHASPACLAGSLDLLADVLSGAGLSAVLCYEVSDRQGHAGARAGIEENLRFLRRRQNDPRVRGVLGLHASFTLREDTLAEAARSLPAGAGCHIHVAEDRVDLEASLRAFGATPLERLERHGLLHRKTLLAHGVHLKPADFARIAQAGSVLVHNPQSNAHNRVGHLNLSCAAQQGCLLGLGTDGMSSSMLRELRAAYLLHRAAQPDSSSAPAAFPDLLHNNALFARRFFNEPRLGELAPGAPADLIAVDTPPSKPLDPENLFALLVFGGSEAPVRHTISRGRILLEDFRHATLDPDTLAARARQLVPGLWQRFHALQPDTSFLGEA
jgi:putative selenium metabolism protein SsnA